METRALIPSVPRGVWQVGRGWSRGVVGRVRAGADAGASWPYSKESGSWQERNWAESDVNILHKINNLLLWKLYSRKSCSVVHTVLEEDSACPRRNSSPSFRR